MILTMLVIVTTMIKLATVFSISFFTSGIIILLI